MNTPRSKAVIGSTAGGPFALGDVTIAPGKTMQNRAAITLTALDGKDFASKGRILVTAAGYAENTGMNWNGPQKTNVGKDWGIAPSLVEGVPATITLPVSSPRAAAWSLDERGQRKESLPVTGKDGGANIEIGARYGTVWYEVEIK